MILVTGGAGFIGSNFVLQWLSASDEPVLDLDKLTYAGDLHNLDSLAGDAQQRLRPVPADNPARTGVLIRATPTVIAEILVIEPKVFTDERGFFFESFNERAFAQATGINAKFVQDNHSRSVKNTVRGLHNQIQQPQAGQAGARGGRRGVRRRRR